MSGAYIWIQTVIRIRGGSIQIAVSTMSNGRLAGGAALTKSDVDKDDMLGLYDSASNPDGSKRDQFTFGAGRRICPGMHVAERSLFLAIARTLWAFNIGPKTDTKGDPVLPDASRLTQGFVCMPQEFSATIEARSTQRADLVRSEWKQAQESLLHTDTKQWLSSPV